MGSLGDFANRMDRRADDIAQAANDLKRRVARTIVANLVYVTPVDTSKALSNWRVAQGTGGGGAIPAHFLGSHGSTQGSSASAAIAAAEAEIMASRPGQALVIYNTVPYIQALNDGSSQQEPAGFVERAILIGRNVVKTQGLRLRRR